MKLNDLIKGVEVIKVAGNTDAQVKDVAYNTSLVLPGVCFVAIPGAKTDGHLFIDDAISRGANVIVSERPLDAKQGVTNIIVADSRRALSLMSANFFGHPSREMTLVGVTGTNGKTTITYLMEAIFKADKRKTGVIGTVEYRFGQTAERAPNTTPESYELQKLLRRMRAEGVSACAMEVSSHALTQGRVVHCEFDAAVFTNLTPEHLDYHSDMESYFEAKALLFEGLLKEGSKGSSFAAINVDDPYGIRLVERCNVPVVTYGLDGSADVKGSSFSFNSSGLSMHVEFSGASFDCRSNLCGRFNAYNILAASAVAVKLGIRAGRISEGIDTLSVVPGRFEPVENDRDILALVDYAHTPDALENSLSNAREIAKLRKGRLISVFGCGGDRDKLKRPLMGRVAANISDIAIVTSDNPRTEDPRAIIEEIMHGVKGPREDGKGYEVIVDRRTAVERAVSLAKAGDVIIVAGKGHEDYQIVGTRRVHFDDREVLREIFGNKRGV